MQALFPRAIGSRAPGEGVDDLHLVVAHDVVAIALEDEPGVYAIACDTDGIDGSEDNAGAVISPDTLHRARSLNLDGQAHLDRNDAYSFFVGLYESGELEGGRFLATRPLP